MPKAVPLKKQKPLERSYGVLMPIFSLDSPYGIGTLGKPAREFIDFLARAGADIWQVLPLGPTGYGNSPYQCFSAFAGNPYFIDPEALYEDGWLKRDAFESFTVPNNGSVDYSLLFKTRKKLLFNAYIGFKTSKTSQVNSEFEEFCDKAAYWLPDYAAFTALKSKDPKSDRTSFGEDLIKTSSGMAHLNANFKEQMEFVAFLEFAFWRQWQLLKQYAAQRKVKLMGDIPLYVANDSADVWAHPELFLLDQYGYPTQVAGVPPDNFSKTGQLWGNPLYRWETHKTTDFLWWKNRIAWQAECFDLLRLDHFIGISRYYSIPANSDTAEHGVWCKGPGKALLSAIQTATGHTKLIAEDLGLLTNDVKGLMRAANLPGMRLLQFAFSGEDNPNLPHNIPQNSVVYPGTHDNQTLSGFVKTASPLLRKRARRYLDVKQNKAIPHAILRECFRSCANTAILPFHDLLGLDDTARINTPSTTNGNWCWRTEGTPDHLCADTLRTFAATYFRIKTKGELS